MLINRLVMYYVIAFVFRINDKNNINNVSKVVFMSSLFTVLIIYCIFSLVENKNGVVSYVFFE